ncbi:MAG: hypothetical protein AAF206_24130 [Bacteroidota bacterium]
MSASLPLQQIELLLWRKGESQPFCFPTNSPSFTTYPVPAHPRYLLEADVAFYKANCLPALHTQLSHLFLSAPQGIFLGDQAEPDFPGRCLKIEEIFSFQPKRIKKYLKAKGIRQLQISQRNFPFSVKKIRPQLGVADGGKYTLFCSLVDGEKKAFLCMTE